MKRELRAFGFAVSIYMVVAVLMPYLADRFDTDERLMWSRATLLLLLILLCVGWVVARRVGSATDET